jgi:hypothetical protein
MKKIILVIMILSIGIAFGQKKDLVLPKNIDISWSTDGSDQKVTTSYARSWYQLEAESTGKKFFSLGGSAFGHWSVGKNQTIRFGMKMKYWEKVTAKQNELPGTTFKQGSFQYFLLFSDLRRRGGVIREFQLHSQNTIFSGGKYAISLVGRLEMKGRNLGKAEVFSINPYFSGSLYNESARNLPDLKNFIIGASLKSYDYQKFYSREVVSLEYQNNASVFGPKHCLNLRINFLGVWDLFKPAPKKENKITYYNYFPQKEEIVLEVKKISLAEYQKFTDFEVCRHQ